MNDQLTGRLQTCIAHLDAAIENAELWICSDAWDELTADEKQTETLHVVRLRQIRERLEVRLHSQSLPA